MKDDAGTLWIVATPIGSLEDLSPRAIRVLEQVDFILAEDTRRSGKLLKALNINYSGRILSHHEHNEKQRLEELLEHLRQGQSMALISDAGTPVLSDPGFLLVRAVREEGLPVASLPGPSAFITGLAASGLPPLPAVLVGFLPPRSGPRKKKASEFAEFAATLVFFLSPHRLQAELADLSAILGESRQASLLAELSKRYERIEFSTLGELLRGREVLHPRGEYVLVVGPPVAGPEETPDALAARLAYEDALSLNPERRMAQRSAAAKLGISRRELYALLLEEKER